MEFVLQRDIARAWQLKLRCHEIVLTREDKRGREPGAIPEFQFPERSDLRCAVNDCMKELILGSELFLRSEEIHPRLVMLPAEINIGL
jgi:hypothetical protein